MFNFDGYTKLVVFKNIENQSIQEVHGQNIPKSERKGIFCDNENAKFTKVAHAVSETIGNKSLISHFECDECNQNFGTMSEDDLNLYSQYVKHIVVLQQLVSSKSIYQSVEQKKEIMRSMENCGLFCLFPGQNPLKEVNVILWKSLDSKEQE